MTILNFKSEAGEFQLERLPTRKKELLQAWDAADTYLVEYLFSEKRLSNDERILLCNDSFGALSVAFHQYSVQSWSDSWLSHQATKNNYALNHLQTRQLSLIDSLSLPQENFTTLILKIPKTLALLEYQLIQLRPLLSVSCRIIVAGMIKTMPSRVWTLIEKYWGSTETSLAKKKSRLICVCYEPTLDSFMNPYPTSFQLDSPHFNILNHANVFSRESLDIGTRFFLSNLSFQSSFHRVADLGCGNGIVGLVMAHKMPESEIHFIDESYMAVDCAKQNFIAAFGESRHAVFQVANGLADYTGEKFDLILCNPPFHQQHTVGDFVAKQFFLQSQKALNKKGQLWVIGNRHLNYHKILKKFFRQVEIISSNKKFTVIRAQQE